MSYMLVLDIGTTNVKAFAYSLDGEMLKKMVEGVTPQYPQPGWVEQDPNALLHLVYRLIDDMTESLGTPEGLALTNQRSSSVVWEKDTGDPLYSMITWQDTRTSKLIERLSSKFLVRFGKFLGKTVKGFASIMPFLKKTRRGAYLISLSHVQFGTNHSSMHLKWMMEHVPAVQEAIESGSARFGTLDSWIAWNLTGKHVTDYTNASATGCFDPFYLKWSENLLKVIDAPRDIFPDLVYNDRPIGTVQGYDMPLLTMIADQQASLYMSGVSKGTISMTNGTGTFIDMNVGKHPHVGDVGVYPMIALGTSDTMLYLLEGFVNATGSAIDWLIDIGLLKSYAEIAEACDLEGENDLTFIPALAGLSTPYGKPDVKGCLMNFTRSTKREDIIEALIQGIAMRCTEVINALEAVTQLPVKKVIADGGASKCDALLQMTADLSKSRISRPSLLNGSAYGAYMLANAIHQEEEVINAWKAPQIEKIFASHPRRYDKFKKTWNKNLRKLQ